METDWVMVRNGAMLKGYRLSGHNYNSIEFTSMSSAKIWSILLTTWQLKQVVATIAVAMRYKCIVATDLLSLQLHDIELLIWQIRLFLSQSGKKIKIISHPLRPHNCIHLQFCPRHLLNLLSCPDVSYSGLDYLQIPWLILLTHHTNGMMWIKPDKHKVASMLQALISYVHFREWQLSLLKIEGSATSVICLRIH